MYQEGDKLHKRGGNHREKVEELRNESGVQNFVVCGVYSPLDHSQEQKAANVIRNIYPNASITESHTPRESV